MATKIKKNTSVLNCWNSIGVWSRADAKCEKLTEYTHCRNCPIFSEMGRSVFERSAPSGYLSHWKKKFSNEVCSDVSETNSVLIFRSGKEWFALPVESLSEIANVRKIHRIPRNLNRFISGVVNINGEVKICYSLSELLDLNAGDVADIKMGRELKRLIVIELAEIQYVFLVDEVIGLHWYGAQDLLPVPATLSFEDSVLLLGSIKKLGYQIAVFDVNKFQEKLEGVLL